MHIQREHACSEERACWHRADARCIVAGLERRSSPETRTGRKVRSVKSGWG
jgi:hypothetical protein